MNAPSSNPDLEQLMHAYLDQELSPAEARSFEQRLARDPSLQKQLEAEKRFRSRFRQRMQQTVAPTRLRRDVESLLLKQASIAASTSSEPQSPNLLARVIEWLRGTTPLPHWAMAASVMLLVVATIGLSAMELTTSPTTTTTHTSFRRLAGKHLVYTQPDLALDVTGTADDIARWFQERLNEPIAIPQLPGWRLLGGRLGEFHHEPAIFLFYQQDGRVVSLVQFSPRDSDFPEEKGNDLDGMRFYEDMAMDRPVILWRQQGRGYGLIGDASQTLADLKPLVVACSHQISQK